MTNMLRFVHVRPYSFNRPDQYASKGGITLAYSMPTRKGDKMIWVSAAFCSKADTYSKKTGRTLAIDKYLAGERIQIATTKSQGIGHQLQQAFRPLMHLAIPHDNEEYQREQRLHKSRQAKEVRFERNVQDFEPATDQQRQEDSPL